jgi:UDP-N-acetylglucosamine--N-acetylmuramyl-(pentapeptide) pyrophosphoryl-undecaprenol N-acetylglucosamine transferase
MSPEDAREHFEFDPSARVVLVVGGSQGAEALNRAMLEAVEGVVEGSLPLREDLRLLWATGPLNLEAVRERLGSLGNPGWIRALGYIHDMPQALSAATLAVSRAGAMATSEFLSWGVPALLVPLPSAAADHQTRNAESLAEAGVALHLPESELTGPGLWAALNVLMDEPETLARMAEGARKRGRPEATRDIALELLELLPRAPLPLQETTP